MMRFWLAVCPQVSTLTLLIGCLAVGRASGDEAASDPFWEKELKPFLETYCQDCHSGEGAEADIDFAQYASAARLSEERPKWNQVRGMIEIGAMPPADYDPQPNRELREKMADWIDRQVNSVDCDIVNDPGRVTMRRLNNVEYDRTLRDLLAIDFSPASLIGFPSDGVGNGFDNQGDVLTLSPLQVEKYLQAAQLITSRIIVDDPEQFREQRKDTPELYRGDRRSVQLDIADGDYEQQARLEFMQDGSQEVPVALLVDGQEVARWDVGHKRATHAVDHHFESGWHELTIHFVDDPGSDKKEYSRRVEIDYLAIKGPRDGRPKLPAAHERLFVARPSDDVSVEAAARQIFEPLMRRAFRQEPNPADVDRTVTLVKLAAEQGETFEQAVAYGLQAVLVSPHFLFRVESAAESADSQHEQLADYELASRLSYFLWASMPDDELLDLAATGQLRSPDVLQRQARRMLADPKADALVTRFFGQFLGLGSLKEVDPDPKQFPQWNPRLREAVRKETELFCGEIVAQDLPLAALLVADFTFVNPRLAELYGIDFDGRDPAELYRQGPGLRRGGNNADRELEYLEEDRWIRVPAPPHRKGVLTQAAILTLTSNPTSTSPVKRGKWILESLLGDPPPPAPPNVPAFDETKKDNAGLTLRQQLEIHRANPSCASCHRVMDPLGLGFENFDAIGQWRDKDGKHPVDAAGELADGRKFNGSVELVSLLTSRQPEIYRHFAEKLLTYALGRGLEPYDNCAIDDIMQHAAQREFRISAFVEAVVASQPFTKRRQLPSPDSQVSLLEEHP